eukprot:m51a1_g12565 hypothetical protein (198) ;mRNA; r:3361-3954
MALRPDPLACAPGAVKIVRKQWVRGATVLNCTRAAADPDKAALLGWTGCRAGMRYVLAADGAEVKTTVPAASDGYVRFHLVEWDPSNPGAGGREVQTTAMTWYGLETLLAPVSVVGNTEQCGYFFVPYETFEEGNARYPAEGHDTPVVSHLELEWDDSSYVNGGAAASGKDYSLLRASTHKMKLTKFHGPFDWNADI